jgi:UDP-N-acetylmuramate: L-alanyl-gamma-D-glutamyl-meso-diaminopimelate ligase
MNHKNTSSEINLPPGSHVHFMGICGTAMASLAGLLKDKGYNVTGSDTNPYPPMSTQLEKLGISIMKGYVAKNLQPKPDFIVVGNVISAHFEEAKAMIEMGINHTSLPKALGELIIEDRQSIVIAGTHGKTTTTSLMAWVTNQCGLKPGFLIGGIPKNFNRSFQNPQGDYFVIEGDEYDTAYFDKVPKFVHYKPRHVILTSVEFDHADIYKDLDAVKEAFKKLLRLIPRDGHLLYCHGDKNIESILSEYKFSKAFSYGIEAGDYQAKILSQDEQFTHFEVSKRGQSFGPFKVPMFGRYNILNALSVIALSLELQMTPDKIKSSLPGFLGVKRRQEIIGDLNGAVVVEDFAHHPTAVRETLKGIKERYNQRRIIAVFEPRSATSRRKVFQRDYAQAFEAADEIIIAKAYEQTKISETDRFSTAELVSDLKNLGKNAIEAENVDFIVKKLKDQASSKDLILIMSNGGFDNIYEKIFK